MTANPRPSRRVKLPADVYERLQAIAQQQERTHNRTVHVAEIATEIIIIQLNKMPNRRLSHD